MTNFLNNCLGASWKASKLKGDSGERQYHRILSSNKSFIFVSCPPRSHKSFKDFLKMQNLLKQKGFLVPKVFFKDEEKLQLLVEDVGHLSLEQYYLANRKLDYHKEALNSIGEFRKMNSSNELSKKFSLTQSLNEMISSYQFLDSPFIENKRVNLFEEFQKISGSLASGPLTPSHRDFHSRNLFIYKDQIYILDFQDAGWYPLYYDLVSLVYDSYIPLSSEERDNLIRYYSHITSLDMDSKLLQLTFCQRGFKAVGSFMSFFRLRGQDTHLKYVHPTLKLIEKALVDLKDYPSYLHYVRMVLNRLQ